jgi:polysaccharide export outer membrane protein
MRVTRSIMLFLAIAVVAAGCASQPVTYAPAPYATTPYGIDAVTYGTVGAPAPAPGYQQTYAPGYQQNYATESQRGLFASYTPATPPATYAVAPARVPVPAPAQQSYTLGATYAYAGAAPPVPTTQSAYTLDSGDRLRVVVFGQDGLSNSYSVDASGHIAMPLIGSVTARGETTDQLASRIADKLRDGYVRDPHVAVEIEAYRPFFILGEVTAPGQYPYVANMTAETAIAIAGGFGPRAFRDSVILNRTYNGQTMRMTIPLSYPLRPGDTVNVQERWF